MRFLALLMLVAISSAPAMAGDLVSEPHALVYYQVPFSGNARDTTPHFGLRLDRAVHERDQAIEFSSFMSRAAVMEVRFGETGMESLSVAGVDYLARYRALRADGDPATGDAGEEGKEEKLTIGKILDDAPVGYIIGAGIGLLLIVGS